MKTSRILGTFLRATSILLVTLSDTRAAVPDIVDSANGPEIIEGFKLFESGGLWWKSGQRPSETIPAIDGVISVRRAMAGINFNRFSSRPFYAVNSRDLAAPPGSVERVGDNLFYHLRRPGPSAHLYRRSVFSAPGEVGIDFTGSGFDQVGAMVAWGGRLYFSGIQGRDMQLRSKPVDGGPGGGDRIEFSMRDAYQAKKIVVVDELIDDGRHFATHLAILTTDGLLYLYEVEGQLAGQPPRLVNSNITDFAVRNEAWRNLGEERTYGTMIYMTTGLNYSASRVSGKLVVFNLTAGPSSTFVMYDTGSRNSQLLSVAVDQDRIFLTRIPLVEAGSIGLLQRFNSKIMRRDYRADRLRPFDELTSFGDLAIEPLSDPLEALQLASDRQWLYWIHSNEVRKVKTDTPFYQLDLAAVGLEAVQAVQDANNAVPLVAGKPTFVRGYAKVSANSLNLVGLKPKALLRGFRNGELLGEVPADNTPLIDANDASIVIRSEFNRSFHFDVPLHWMVGGPLRLQMTVNPGLSIPETGGAPLANNTVARDFDVVNVVTPCLWFKTMDSNNPDYTMADPGFWPIIDRARSLMPVPDFHVHYSPGIVSKPVYRFFLPPRIAPFTMPDDKDWAMIWMTLAHAFSLPPGGCNDLHWVGMFPPGDRPWNGIGGIRNVSLSDLIEDPPFNISVPNTPLAYTSCVRMDSGQGNSANPWSSIMGGHTLAHELGHNYGRFHIDQTRSLGCGISKPDRPWHLFPGDPCTLGEILLSDPAAPVGYDPLNYVQVLPNMAGDLMSYANSSWVSPFTWNAVLDVLPKLPNPAGGAAPQAVPAHSGATSEPGFAAAAVPGNIFFVQGTLRPWERTAVLYPAFALPPGVMDPAMVQQLAQATDRIQAGSPYRLRLVGNPAAAPLAERPILFLPATDNDAREVAFMQPLSQVPGVTRIQVVQEGTVLAELIRSANAPEVALGPPAFNAANESLALNWTATDRDGDLILFTVQFTPDNGVTWETLQVNDPTLGVAVSTRLLRSGNQCRLRVIATDGLNTTVATSATFILPKHVPVISHAGIREQQRVPFGSNVTVRFFAYDAEDGSIAPTRLSWNITGREGRSGEGGLIPIAHLPPGAYTLGMSAVDADGNVSSAAVPFQILPLVVMDGAMDPLDGLGNDAGYAVAPPLRLIRAAAEPEARFVHTNGNLHVFVSGLRVSDGNAVPGILQLWFDPDFSRSSTLQPGDLGFTIDESGFVTQYRGTGGGWSAETSPSPGVRSEILRSEDTWNIELSIPDSLLGGWNHSAGLMFWYQRNWWIGFPGVSVPDAPLFWPFGNLNEPASWAEVYLGTPPIGTNRPPIAVATGPGVVGVIEPQTVHLNGSGSYDPDLNSLTYSWTQTAGPAVTLSNSLTATASFTTPHVTATTTLRFQLVVNDGQRSSTPAVVSVTLVPFAGQPAGSPAVSVNPTAGTATAGLQWDGSPGDRVAIQASTDFIHWEDLATNTVGFLQSILYTDSRAGLFPHRFYRAASRQTAPPPPRAELHFDGVDDYVEVPHSAALNAWPLTLTAWFRTTQSNGSFRGLVTKYDGTTGFGYGIGLDQGQLSCWYQFDSGNFVWDHGASTGMPFVADGRWHHVAFVVDNISGGRVYLDGSLVRTTAWQGFAFVTTTTIPLRFGVYLGGTGLPFNGDLDEIAVWNRALTAVEINRLIPSTLTGTELGLLGCWNLNTGSGQTAVDNSPNGRHGALRNGPQWFDSTAPLRPNPAAGTTLRFDGVDDLAQVPHNAALNAFPLTIAGWIKTAQKSPGYVAIANKYFGGSGNGYSLHIHNGQLAAFYFRGDGSSFIYPGDPGLDGGFIADGQWHHVAYVVDANGGRLYVDGAQTASLGWSGTPGGCTTTTPLSFGQYPLGGQALSLDGRIDELTLWNRPLDANELNVLMNFKQTGGEPGLIGYWPFDAATGPTATDATGHGHNGALQNGPLWLSSDAPINAP